MSDDMVNHPPHYTQHPPTECCGYSLSSNLQYPVMWNEYNKVVQCHNCGHIYVPKDYSNDATTSSAVPDSHRTTNEP